MKTDEEFLGFDPEDLENDDPIAPFEDTWVQQNLDDSFLLCMKFVYKYMRNNKKNNAFLPLLLLINKDINYN